MESTNVKTEFSDGVMTAAVSGEIDHHTSKKIRESIDDCLAKHSPDKLVLDFSGVTFMDSSGLGLVMGRHRLTQAAGIAFEIQNIPPRPMQMFKMAGIERIIKINAGKEEENEKKN